MSNLTEVTIYKKFRNKWLFARAVMPIINISITQIFSEANIRLRFSKDNSIS